jgi:hypothetical protein
MPHGNFWLCHILQYKTYQGHEKSQKQRLKERFKSNFQTRNKTILCDSKTKCHEHEKL